MDLARIELVTLVQIGTVEAFMQGLLDKSGETINRIYRRWGIGVFALPVLLAIALVGLAMTPRAASNWITQATEAEFAGANYRLEAAPAQPAKRGHRNSNRQSQLKQATALQRSKHLDASMGPTGLMQLSNKDRRY